VIVTEAVVDTVAVVVATVVAATVAAVEDRTAVVSFLLHHCDTSGLRASSVALLLATRFPCSLRDTKRVRCSAQAAATVAAAAAVATVAATSAAEAGAYHLRRDILGLLFRPVALLPTNTSHPSTELTERYRELEDWFDSGASGATPHRPKSLVSW
jgi:hypothetical protein